MLPSLDNLLTSSRAHSKICAAARNAVGQATVRSSQHKKRREASTGGPTLRQLGPYQLLELIGSGAIGDVYRGLHVPQDRIVAIKVLRPELAQEPLYIACFITEARIVNCLEHEHIIKVTDVVHDPAGAPWLVMELLEGADLAAHLAGGAFDLARSLQITRQVCEALSAIHEAGIVHRDIKPQNLFITTRDELDFVKVIDFGVAQFWGPNGSERRPRHMIGTPQYMAPEQVTLSLVDHRADLYAIGVVLFESITGVPPFSNDDLLLLLNAVSDQVPPVPSQQAEVPIAVRADLDLLIGSCLAKDPDQRPQSAEEIGESLDRIAASLERGSNQQAACGTVAGPAATRQSRLPSSWSTTWPVSRPESR